MWEKYKNHIILAVLGGVATILTYAAWDLVRDTHTHVYIKYHPVSSDITEIKMKLDQIDSIVKNNEFRLNQIRYNYLLQKRSDTGLDHYEQMELSILYSKLFPGQVP